MCVYLGCVVRACMCIRISWHKVYPRSFTDKLALFKIFLLIGRQSCEF